MFGRLFSRKPREQPVNESFCLYETTEDIVIGIDLGTTNSCAACYIDGKMKILVNRDGGRVTPSVVFFTEKKQTVVGNCAKRMASAKPEYAVCEIKRLVGRKTDDAYVQNNLKYFPFKLDSTSNEPIVLIEGRKHTLKKSPVDICAAILKKIKTDSEAKLETSVEKAVITVPAYFNVNQREVTLAAASKAGFAVLKLFNEPTAAALAYYVEHEYKTEDYSLVYDLGGGTFDVAVVKRRKENIDVIGVNGDTHIGGEDFDNLIVDYVCDELYQRYKCNPRSDRRHMRRLHNLCEEAKQTLSVAEETTIVLDAFVKNHDVVEINITRIQFESMISNLIDKTVRIVDSCLKSCNLSKNDVKEVILSGGSTRIPKIRTLLSDYFNGKALNEFVNPDECVAEGAALQAAMLSSSSQQKIINICITDVVPLSLGVLIDVGQMNFLIKRNTPIPVTKSHTYFNVDDKQKAIHFTIYEGERLNAKKNHCLGKLEITGLTPAPPRTCAVIFTMSIDSNGILRVSAKEEYKDNVKELNVTYTRGHFSDGEIKNALQDAKDHEIEDEEFIKYAKHATHLINYCNSVVYNFENKKLKGKYNDIYDLCKATKEKAVDVAVENVLEVKEMIKDIEDRCRPIVAQHNFENMPNLSL